MVIIKRVQFAEIDWLILGIPLTPKPTFLRLKNMSITSKFVGVIAVRNGLRP